MAFRLLPKPVPKSCRPPAPSVTVAPVPMPSASGRIALGPVVMPSCLTPSLRDSVTLGLDPTRIFRNAGHTPDPWQRKVLLSSAARQLFLCSRQVGKSYTAAAIALHHAIYTSDALILLLSPSLRQSRELFRRVAGLRSQLLFQVPLTRETDLCLDFENGSRVICLPGTEETIRGYSGVTLLIIDEAARVPDALYYSVRPMLAISGGRLICMSTPWGQRGWFYEAWTSEEPWERTRVTAPECPRLSQAFLDEERRTHGRQSFAQEYMAEFARASDQAFEVELVRAAFDVNVQPLFNAEEMIHFNHSPDCFSTRRQVMTLRHPTTGRVITARQKVVRRNVIRRGSGLDTRSRSDSSNEYAIGLDLAQVRDYSAIAIIEKVLPPQPDALSSTSLNEPEYHVRHVARFDLGTPYPDIVSRVGEMMQHPKLRDRTRLVLDRTGVGAPVADMFLHAGLQPMPITITSGQRVNFLDAQFVCRAAI